MKKNFLPFEGQWDILDPLLIDGRLQFCSFIFTPKVNSDPELLDSDLVDELAGINRRTAPFIFLCTPNSNFTSTTDRSTILTKVSGTTAKRSGTSTSGSEEGIEFTAQIREVPTGVLFNQITGTLQLFNELSGSTKLSPTSFTATRAALLRNSRVSLKNKLRKITKGDIKAGDKVTILARTASLGPTTLSLGQASLKVAMNPEIPAENIRRVDSINSKLVSNVGICTTSSTTESLELDCPIDSLGPGFAKTILILEITIPEILEGERFIASSQVLVSGDRPSFSSSPASLRFPVGDIVEAKELIGKFKLLPGPRDITDRQPSEINFQRSGSGFNGTLTKLGFRFPRPSYKKGDIVFQNFTLQDEECKNTIVNSSGDFEEISAPCYSGIIPIPFDDEVVEQPNDILIINNKFFLNGSKQLKPIR